MANTVQVIPTFYVRPTARVDVDFRVVSTDNDTVQSVAAIVIAPAGQLTSDDIDIVGNVAKVWLNAASAVDEVDYLVTAKITTQLGRIEVGVVTIKVRA